MRSPLTYLAGSVDRGLLPTKVRKGRTMLPEITYTERQYGKVIESIVIIERNH